MTAPRAPRGMREVFFLRRLLFLYLPIIAAGMTAYIASYALTVTINGLGLLALTVVFFTLVLAALDGRDF